MNTANEVSFKSDSLTGSSAYDSYNAIKTQLGYFHEEGLINRTQRELLEKPRWAISFTLPTLKRTGRNKPINCYMVKQGRTRESFISRIIYDPGLAKENIKTIALGDHLRAKLADIPFEPVPVGVEIGEADLSGNLRSQIENHVKMSLQQPLHYQSADQSLSINAHNKCANQNFRSPNHCLSNILLALKKLKFPGRKKIKVAASKINSFTRKECKLLPENEFQVLPRNKDKVPREDVLVLSDQKPLSLNDARGLKAEVIVDLFQGAVDPEVRAILAEKDIDIIPNIVTSLPEIIKLYFNGIEDYKLGFSNSDSFNNHACRLTTKAFRSAWKLANRESISLTSAAFALAIKRSAKIQSFACSFSLSGGNKW